jgi:hypothetical protein
MSLSTVGNKVAGTFFIIFGLLFICYLFYSLKLILDNYSLFKTRYFTVILAGYGGLFSIFLGVSYFTGFLIPYYKANTYEKAKSNIFISIFGLPLFLFSLISAYVNFNSYEVKTYKILMIIFSAIMALFCLRSFLSNLKILKNLKKKHNA